MKKVKLFPFKVHCSSDHLVEELAPIATILKQMGVSVTAFSEVWDEVDVFPKGGLTFYYSADVFNEFDYYDTEHHSDMFSELPVMSSQEVMDKLIETVPKLSFGYTNYKGAFDWRTVVAPIIHYGCSEYHNDGKPTWLMSAFCLSKNALRDFQMSDIATIAKD